MGRSQNNDYNIQRGHFLNPIPLLTFLGSLNYPITKEDVIDEALDDGIDESAIVTIEAAAQDKFQDADELSRAIIITTL